MVDVALGGKPSLRPWRAGRSWTTELGNGDRYASMQEPGDSRTVRMELYDASSPERANCLLREFRTDDVHLIVSSRLDILFDLQDLLAPDEPCEVISAYRSPEIHALQLR
jgi:uncharacterized protein YcbK (DUF882 family)